MIQDGLLWFDDNPTRPVGDKIERAVQSYKKKYGHSPNVCYLNPMHLKEGDANLAEDVRILPTNSVLPCHFWLGIQSAIPPVPSH